MTVAKQLATSCVAAGCVLGVVSASALAHATTDRASLSALRVSSTPEGTGVLSLRHLNTVAATAKLAFVVTLHNSGARRRVTFTLTVSRTKSPLGPLVKKKTVWLRGNRPATVKIGPFTPVLFADPQRLKLSIADARHRENWTAVYPVIFSLG